MPLEILAYEETSLGLLCLRRRELLCNPGVMVTEVTLNHEFLMSSYLTESERALSYFGLDRCRESDGKQKLTAMVGGLGLGYTANELLKSASVTSVEVIEFLPQVIGWTKDGLIPLSEQLNSDSRLTITQGDIYARLGKHGVGNFGLIVIDVDHSPEDVLGEQSNQFYSEAGLKVAKTHLKPSGVIGIWSYAESSPLLESMKNVFEDVSVEQVTVLNDLIQEEQTDWIFYGRND